MARPLRTLVLVPGALDGQLRGPEIRAWELARALARDDTVTAGVPGARAGGRDGVRLVPWTRRALLRELARQDAVLSACLPPFLLAAKSVCRVLAISDQYDPQELELATLDDGAYRTGELRAAQAARRLQLRHADLILCAGGRQREALQRAWPAHATAPPPLVVPFGIPPAPPAPRQRPLRERFTQIGDQDRIVLWWGSIWRWLDAATVIRAVAAIQARRDDVKLVITAGRATGGDSDRFAAAQAARALAAELGALNRSVFFLDDWVAYEQRHEVLADADVGITLPLDRAEAQLAARARYMDYLWAGLPCVLGHGDETAEEFAAAGFATCVAPGDPAAVERALLALIDDPAALAAARAAGARLAQARGWDAVGATLGAAIGGLPPARRVAPGRDLLDLVGQAGAYYAERALARLVEIATACKEPAAPGVDAA
jgi:glycosyltransferase involved in cell wall biosynthesis